MASKSLASLLLRPIQAKNRSTTQRLGKTTKPIDRDLADDFDLMRGRRDALVVVSAVGPDPR